MEQSSLFQFSIDNALELIIIFEDDSNIVYANQSATRMLEYEDGLVGCLIGDIFPELWEEGDVLKQSVREACGEEIRDLIAYRKNRTCFPTKVKILPYKCEENECEGKLTYFCMAYDVSKEYFWERKANRAVLDAEKALKVKSEFVANVTHELRTPVNGILGNTQALVEMEQAEDKLKLLRLVERGCRDMNSIINNILDFSKLEAGKFVLEPRKFHFRNMIDYVTGNHMNRITEKGLTLSVTVSPQIPESIIADELRIVQVLNNLISNAYKFTATGGIHVEIVMTNQVENRAELFFMVMDTGIGIAKADQDKLFKSFSQVDASISRKYGGTGLGLNICKQLVELMGGNIQVESEVRKGTVFSFHIWVELPEEATVQNVDVDNKDDGLYTDEQALINKLQGFAENNAGDRIWHYGEPENLKEIKKQMSKLILSVEMENWEKAEMFAETLKQLVEEAPKEVKSAAFRLKMSVQKGDYEKTTAAYELLQQKI